MQVWVIMGELNSLIKAFQFHTFSKSNKSCYYVSYIRGKTKSLSKKNLISQKPYPQRFKDL